MGNVEATKERLIRSVLKVLKRDGFAALGVSAVARQAKLGKPLIYRYFGGLTGLVKAVASTPEFWPPVEEIVKPPAARVTTSYGHVVGGAVVRLLQALRARPVTCEFLAWELVEKNALTQVVDAALAQLGRATVTQARQHALPPENIDAAAQNVLLLAGIFYLAIRSRTHDEFAGMSLATEGDWARLARAVEHLAERGYRA